jgi:nicotinamide riboside kinase
MRIGLCGTMSVGKTTLVNALRDLPEFKDYYFRTERSKYLSDLGIPLNTDSTLKGQLVFAAERATELLQENIITDRTIIDVMAFCKLSSSMENHEKQQINGVLWNLIKDYDIIFYVSPKGVEMEDNGVRETNLEYRNAVDRQIRSILKSHKSLPGKVVEIEGTTKERIKQIKDTLASL